MTKDINLLKEKVAILRKEARKAFFLQVGLLVILIGYCLTVVVLFSYYFILKRQSSSLEEEIRVNTNKVEEFQTVETQQVYLKNKIESLSDVFADQKHHQKITEAVFTLLPEGISVSGFNIDDKGGVSFQGESDTFSRLRAFLDNLKTTYKIGEMKVERIDIERIFFDYEKGYVFKVYLLFEV